MKKLLHTTVLATAILLSLLGVATANPTTVQELQNAVESADLSSGLLNDKVHIVKFENGVVTLGGSMEELLEISVIRSMFRKFDDVEKIVITLVIRK